MTGSNKLQCLFCSWLSNINKMGVMVSYWQTPTIFCKGSADIQYYRPRTLWSANITSHQQIDKTVLDVQKFRENGWSGSINELKYQLSHLRGGCFHSFKETLCPSIDHQIACPGTPWQVLRQHIVIWFLFFFGRQHNAWGLQSEDIKPILCRVCRHDTCAVAISSHLTED